MAHVSEINKHDFEWKLEIYNCLMGDMHAIIWRYYNLKNFLFLSKRKS